MTIAFADYTTAGARSPIWLLELALFLEGAGISNVMPPSTAAIMASVPRESAARARPDRRALTSERHQWRRLPIRTEPTPLVACPGVSAVVRAR